MSNPSELRAWVEELLAEKQGRERAVVDLQYECRRLRAERDSMAKRIKAAEKLLGDLATSDLWPASLGGYFKQVAQALEAPAEELPF